MAAKLPTAIVVLGLALQAALPVAYVAALLHVATTFGTLSGATNEAAGTITQGTAEALRAVVIGQRIALVGLPLFALPIWFARMRQRWVFWCAITALVFWVFCIGVGTAIGIVGIWILFSHRSDFLKNEQNQPTIGQRP